MRDYRASHNDLHAAEAGLDDATAHGLDVEVPPIMFITSRAAVHPRPLPEIVRVDELAAEVHLDELGIAALRKTIGNILFPVAPILPVARAD